MTMVRIGWQEIVFVVVATTCYVAVGIWMYNDAKGRGMRGAPWLWAWLLFHIIALVIYLRMRPPRPPQRV